MKLIPIPNHYTHKPVFLGLLGDTTEEEIRSPKNGEYSIYAVTPDTLLKHGLIKIEIGFSKNVLNRFEFGHFFKLGCRTNKQDEMFSLDIDEIVYMQILKRGIKTEQEAREWEATYQAQYGVDVYEDKNLLKTADLTLLYKWYPSIKERTYNTLIQQEWALERERKNIFDGKYSFIKTFTDNLIEVGALNPITTVAV